MSDVFANAASDKILQVFTRTAPPATTATAASVTAAQAKAQAQATYQASISAYKQSLAQLAPVWSPLPTAPYPPSGDTSNFPRTGTPSLFVSPVAVSAAALAEPSKIVYWQSQMASARLPSLNLYFLIGAACLAGYLVVRR